jgi:DHA1 family bicyclomycin/chloramphenicol resistance-like MFS transporter
MNNRNSDNAIKLTTSRHSGTDKIKLLLILGSLAAFGPLTIDMYLPAFPQISESLQTSTSLTQLSLTFCLLGLASGQIIAGSLSDVYGRRTPLIIGLIVFVFASILCAMSPSIWVLILSRFLQGLASATGIVISRATVRDLYSGIELTKFYALLMLVSGVAPILAPIVGGQILLFTTWQGVFYVLSAIGAILLVFVILGLRETLPTTRRSQGGIKNTLSTYRSLLTDRFFMGLALTQGLVGAAMFTYISGSPFVLQNIYGASPQMFSVFFAINGAGIIIASQLTSRLAERFSVTTLLAIGLTTATIGGVSLLIMIIVGAALPGILLALFLVVSSVGIINPASFTMAMQTKGQSAGSAAAVLGLTSYLFGAIAAPIAGISGSDTALPLGITIATAEICAVFCYVLLIRRNR